jgi:multimeric flavodoxin WrbA
VRNPIDIVRRFSTICPLIFADCIPPLAEGVKMNVVAFNGSPKEQGNTAAALQLVAAELEGAGVTVNIVHLGKEVISGCIACGACIKNRNERCIIESDKVNDYIQLMKNADGILIGSPVHFASIGGTMKSFLDRAFYVSGVNDSLFRHKVGAAVVAVRRSGGVTTFDSLNHYINYAEMVMPGANYWNVIHGTRPGDTVKDEEGEQIMRTLGRNMLWLLQLIEAGKSTLPAPALERKVYTNFVR